MYRQRSILSFLGRPSTEKEGSGGLSSVANDHHDLHRTKQGLQRSSSIAEIPVKELFPDIRGTGTPPEKLPRPVFSVVAQATADDDRRGARPFASIMQKFTREDRSRNSVKWSQSSETCHHQLDEIGQSLKNSSMEVLLHSPQMSNVSTVNKNCTEIDPENLNLETSIIGPKTPAMRSLAPHLKRLQEEPCNVNDNGLSPLHFSKRIKSVEDVSIGKGSHAETLDCEGNKSESTSTSLKHLSDACYKDNSPPLDSQKKVKSIPSLGIGKRTHEEASEVVCSKFEWLNPSSIRDANGRRPNDPLFDKRTLYIPPDALKKMSASQKQYWSVKCKYMDAILFFKVGKFYELYELDAEIGHRELDWKMTISGVGKCRQVGISEAGIDDAVEKLIARGYKVGRMEQLETADQAKARGTTSVIERKLVHVSTPSTMTHGSIGPDAVHLLAIKERKGLTESGSTVCGFAFLDYAALKVWVGSISNDDSYAALGALMMQVFPREIVHENRGLSKETQKALVKYASAGSTKMQLTPTSPTVDFPDASEVRKSIHSKQFFRGSWTSAFHNIMEQDLVLCALGGLIDHLCRMMLDDALKNGELFPYHVYRNCLRLDGQTLVNLEIFGNNVDGGPSGTLYKYLDHCMTTSGKRLLKRWICHPLKEIEEINNRLNIVEELIKHSGVNSVISDHLRRIPDLERLLGCVKASIGSSTAFMLPSIGEKLLKQRIRTLGSLLRGLRVGIDLLICLQKEDSGISALSKVVPLPTLSGLDEWLKQFEVAMEDDFPHYQDHNVKDADAETLVVLVELFAGKVAEWSQIIHALNCIDVLQSFAACAILSSGSMNRPIFLPANGHGIISNRDNGPVLHIKGLWHPYAVGENGNSLVPNDINLGQDSGVFQPSTLLLTGPNMGGKSTLLRATCLAAILAQLGCYVPCEMCLLTPADLIFTRLGAADRIMSGESTFFVECSETASVLQNATRDSIVLLDELGRGTSTFDGYSIAYAVFRHLVEKVGCRLLFATHYHPLTEEFASHPRVTLQHMACALKPKNGSFKDGEKDLIFLYRLASGACPESYGLQVALMSGIPKQVVNAASEASQRMKAKISENFRSSERRSNFSTLHEEWIRTILAVSRTSISCWDEDASDTLLCLWHELKSCHESRRNIVT